MTNEEIVKSIQSGNTDEMENLWNQMEGTVKWRARRLASALNGKYGVDFDDLYQTGYLALVAAVDSFDADKGLFSSWFTLCLRTAFAEAVGYRTQKDKNDPLNKAYSLDAPVSNDEDSLLLGEVVPDTNSNIDAIEEDIFRDQMHNAIDRALEKIPDRHRDVIRMRYLNKQTLVSIGELLRISKDRVRQIEKQAISYLRRSETAWLLKPFYNFNYFGGTGLSSFRSSGMSIQERYLTQKERKKRLMQKEYLREVTTIE